jgi:hypothetical protein
MPVSTWRVGSELRERESSKVVWLTQSLEALAWKRSCL